MKPLILRLFNLDNSKILSADNCRWAPSCFATISTRVVWSIYNQGFIYGERTPYAWKILSHWRFLWDATLKVTPLLKTLFGPSALVVDGRRGSLHTILRWLSQTPFPELKTWSDIYNYLPQLWWPRIPECCSTPLELLPTSSAPYFKFKCVQKTKIELKTYPFGDTKRL